MELHCFRRTRPQILILVIVEVIVAVPHWSVCATALYWRQYTNPGLWRDTQMITRTSLPVGTGGFDRRGENFRMELGCFGFRAGDRRVIIGIFGRGGFRRYSEFRAPCSMILSERSGLNSIRLVLETMQDRISGALAHRKLFM